MKKKEIKSQCKKCTNHDGYAWGGGQCNAVIRALKEKDFSIVGVMFSGLFQGKKCVEFRKDKTKQ